ncbi:MAG: sugar phosphate nucleotidyltransferase [Chloroflexota bacterium]|nr:sugar phosphate nucleotidyltransferase [Chloroflexota bacterium]
MSDHELFALILAGGAGTRLWPRSRGRLPKQMLNLTGKRTMLQQTVDRIREMIPPTNIWIMTNQEYVGLAQQQVPEVPPDHVVGEPAPRGTAPAIGLGVQHVTKVAPKGIMFALHADHYIRDEIGFRDAMWTASEVAREGWLVNLGVEPTRPETAYGYVALGAPLETFEGEAYRVVRFTEKPDYETARQFLESGDYLWNSGIFCWRVDVIQRAFEKHLPEVQAVLRRIGQSLNTPQADAVLAEEWSKLEQEVSIDRGIMERAEQVATVPMNVGWSDVGAWDSLATLMPTDEQGNSVTGQGDTLVLDSRNVFVHSEEKFVAVVGAENLIVVDTEDALLIMTRDKAQEVKQIVRYLRGQEREELL